MALRKEPVGRVLRPQPTQFLFSQPVLRSSLLESLFSPFALAWALAQDMSPAP